MSDFKLEQRSSARCSWRRVPSDWWKQPTVITGPGHQSLPFFYDDDDDDDQQIDFRTWLWRLMWQIIDLSDNDGRWESKKINSRFIRFYCLELRKEGAVDHPSLWTSIPTNIHPPVRHPSIHLSIIHPSINLLIRPSIYRSSIYPSN